MPTWPTNKPDSNRFNADSDSIKQSREDLKTMSDAVNDIVDFVDTTGIADGKILVYNASNARFEIGDGGGVTNPLTANLETNEFTIGHLQGDDSAGGVATAMRFTDNGEIHLFTSNKFSGGTGGGADEVKLANAKFDRFLATGGAAGDNTNYGQISLFSQDLNTDDSAGTLGHARVSVLNNADGVKLENYKQGDDVPLFNAELLINQRDGVLIDNKSNKFDSAGDDRFFDSAGEDPSSITLRTTAGNVRLEPSNTIYLKYGLWPTTDGSNGQILQTNGAGQLSWVTNTGGSGLSDIVNDTTPQLGGNLDVNGNDIVTTSNANLELAPDGSGKTVLRGNDNSGALQFNCENNSHGQVVQAQPHSAGVTNNLTLPAGSDQELVGTSATQTLTNKRLTSPKINEDVALTSTATELNLLDGITGIADEDNMSSDSNTKLATQQSIKAYVDAEVASAGGGGASGNLVAGDNIAFSNPDSAGQATVSLKFPLDQPVDVDFQTVQDAKLRGYREEVNTGLGTSGTINPSPRTGNLFDVTLSGNITINGMDTGTFAAGDSVTMILRQPSSGGPHTLSSTMKFAGGIKTLSTTANAVDVLTITYLSGAEFLASLSTNFS